MEKLTVKDMRRAVGYVRNGNRQTRFDEITEEEFLKMDFGDDLQMGNIRLANVVIELQRIHQFRVPLEVFKRTKNGSVGALMEAINMYIEETPEA